MRFGDATVEIALTRHSTIQPGLTDIYASLYGNDAPPYTEEEKKEAGNGKKKALEYGIALRTEDEPVQLVSNLAKEPVPVNLQINLASDKPVDGD